MGSQKKFMIFYSWQSDLPGKTNLKSIRNALRYASFLVEEHADIRVTLDEETRGGGSGSPNVPATILQKISVCDLFVCDLTTINSSSGEEYRKSPNPNVLFELGYAVSTLGWGRVVMLFNKHFGKFPGDLPFDIDRHRASCYLLSEDDSKNKSNISNLQTLLKSAINAVLANNPKRPAENNKKSPEEIKKIRDVQNLTWALSVIHLPAVDQMISDLSRYLKYRVFYFWESFRGVVENSLFHLYDPQAADLIKDVCAGWGGCLGHGEQYHMAPNSDFHIFFKPRRCGAG